MGRFAARLGACGAGRCGLWPRLSGGPTAVSAAYCYRPPVGAFREKGSSGAGRFLISIFISVICAHLEFLSMENDTPPGASRHPPQEGGCPGRGRGEYWLLDTGCWQLAHFHICTLMGVVNPAVFLTQRSRGAERQRIPRGASRDFGKRVAARGFARARRAAGGFACKPASAIGPPQRCVASPPPDLETRFAGHGRPTGKGLREVVSSGFKTPWDFSKFARSAQPRTLCFSASPPLCVKDQHRTCALRAEVCKCENVKVSSIQYPVFSINCR